MKGATNAAVNYRFKIRGTAMFKNKHDSMLLKLICFTHDNDHGCENQSFVKYEFCQTLIFKCSLFSDFAHLANKIWYTGRATIALPIFQV